MFRVIEILALVLISGCATLSDSIFRPVDYTFQEGIGVVRKSKDPLLLEQTTLEKVSSYTSEFTRWLADYYDKDISIIQGCLPKRIEFYSEPVDCTYTKGTEIIKGKCNGYAPERVSLIQVVINEKIPNLESSAFAHEIVHRVQYKIFNLNDPNHVLDIWKLVDSGKWRINGPNTNH